MDADRRTSGRALIIQPPLALSRAFIDLPWFDSLGVLQAAAVLAEAGWGVEVIDGLACADGNLLEQGGLAWLGQTRERFSKRLSGRADLVLIHAGPWSSYEPGRSELLQLLTRIRKQVAGPLVVADMATGGSHYVEADPEPLLSAGADLVLRYEGEDLLRQLATELEAGGRPGGVIRENREAFGLSDLPAPAWERIDPRVFFEFCARAVDSTWRPGPYPAEPIQSLPLVTSRGCPYGCVFCSCNPGLAGDRRQVRRVPMERLADWIQRWVTDLGLRRLIILDDVVNLDPARFDRLLGLLEKHDLAVEFPNGLRADRLEREQVHRLAGRTSQLKVSLESASLRVQRDVLGKNLDPAAVERVAAWCRTEGLPLQVHALIGTPGETRPEIIETLEACADLVDRHGVQIRQQVANPLPGTRLHDICQRDGLLTDAEPEDLAAGFQGRSRITTDAFDPDFLDQAGRILERRTSAPAHRKVIVNLTYRCNNHCAFCAVGDRPSRDADPEAVEQALAAHRANGFDLLDVDGGEPSLHPDLLRVLRTGRRLGFERIALITNGRRAAYPAFARELVDTGLDEILVSLHGPDPGIQDALTQAPGSFAQTLAGIDNLLAALADADRLAVNTTLVRANLSALAELAGLLAARGVRRWNLQVVTPFGRASADQVPDTDAVRAALQSLLADPPPDMHLQVINLPPCELPGHEDRAAADFAKAERNMVFVGAHGENLQAFLSSKRRYTQRCSGCPWALLCPGEYEFEA